MQTKNLPEVNQLLMELHNLRAVRKSLECGSSPQRVSISILGKEPGSGSSCVIPVIRERIERDDEGKARFGTTHAEIVKEGSANMLFSILKACRYREDQVTERLTELGLEDF